MPWLDHFGLIAPFYERAIPLRTIEHLLQHLALPCPPPEGGDGGPGVVDCELLDAGGGTGRVAKALAPYVRRVVVADLSSGMLRQARGQNGLSLAQTHIEALPFPDASFERVVMVDALHHVCDHAGSAREMWRVLKPGGRIVIEEPDLRTFAVKLVALAEKLALMRSHFLAPPAIAALFPYPQAAVTHAQDGFNAWVIVEKQGL